MAGLAVGLVSVENDPELPVHCDPSVRVLMKHHGDRIHPLPFDGAPKGKYSVRWVPSFEGLPLAQRALAGAVAGLIKDQPATPTTWLISH